MSAGCASTGRRAFLAGPHRSGRASRWGPWPCAPNSAPRSPPVAEIRKLLWHTVSPVATYACRPDADHPQNAWLYVCEDQDYGLDKVNAKVRSNIRRRAA